jgi:hypothetical protein
MVKVRMMIDVDVVEHGMAAMQRPCPSMESASVIILCPDAKYLRNQLQSLNLRNSKQPSCFKSRTSRAET